MTKCWWSHRWSKWIDHARITARSPFDTVDDGSYAYAYILQQRRCEECNKLQSRRVNE